MSNKKTGVTCEGDAGTSVQEVDADPTDDGHGMQKRLFCVEHGEFWVVLVEPKLDLDFLRLLGTDFLLKVDFFCVERVLSVFSTSFLRINL